MGGDRRRGASPWGPAWSPAAWRCCWAWAAGRGPCRWPRAAGRGRAITGEQAAPQRQAPADRDMTSRVRITGARPRAAGASRSRNAAWRSGGAATISSVFQPAATPRPGGAAPCRFLDQQPGGGQVPGHEVHMEERVDAPAGDIGQGQHSRAEDAQAAHLRLHQQGGAQQGSGHGLHVADVASGHALAQVYARGDVDWPAVQFGAPPVFGDKGFFVQRVADHADLDLLGRRIVARDGDAPEGQLRGVIVRAVKRIDDPDVRAGGPATRARAPRPGCRRPGSGGPGR